MPLSPVPPADHDPFGPPLRLAEPAVVAAVPAVVVDGDRVRISGLTVADPDVVAGARRADDPADPEALVAWTRAVLAIGARAAAVAAGAEHADALAARMEDLSDRLTRASQDSVARIGAAVDRAADPGGGTLRLAVDQSLQRLSADVGGLLSGESSVLRGQVAAALAESSARASARIEHALAQALSPSDGPLALLRQDVARSAEETRRQVGAEVAAVRDLVAAAKAESAAMRRTAVKGARFEEQAVAAISAVASATGDTCLPTGTVTGLDGKAGDAVVRCAGALPGGGELLIAVEAKDHQRPLGTEAWRRQLDAARANRGAAAGAIGIAKGPAGLPGDRRVVIVDPVSVVVVWDPDQDGTEWLAAAYLLVKAAATAGAMAGTGRDADLAAVAEAVVSAREVLAGYDELARSHSAARRALVQSAETAERMRAALSDRLGRALRLLAPPAAA